MVSTKGDQAVTTACRARSGLLLLGILLVAANLRAGITAVGPVLGMIRNDLGFDGTTASIITSIPLVAFAVLSPLAPAIAVKLGMERTLWLSLFLLMAAIVIRSLPATAAIWIGTALLGIAIALINVILPALIKRDYPNSIGKITGLYSSVQGGAAALSSGFAVPIAGVSQHGWRLSIGIWAGLALIALAVFAPQLRQRTVPAHISPSLQRKPPSPWKSTLAWQITTFMGLQSLSYYTIITWWPSIEQAHDISATASGWYMFALQACSIIGALGTAAILHRGMDQRMLGAAITGMTVIGVAGILFAPELALVWSCVSGLGGGGGIVFALSLFGLRTRHHTSAAALSGMAQSFGYLVAAAGPILFGLLHDGTNSWTLPLIALLISLGVQSCAGFLSGRDRYLDSAPGVVSTRAAVE